MKTISSGRCERLRFFLVSDCLAGLCAGSARSMPTACPPPIPRRPKKPRPPRSTIKSAATNAAADAQADADKAKYQEQQQAYQSQQQQYRNQLERNKDQQEQYRDRTAAYESLRARFAAERAAYHRGVWPERYVKWVIVERDARSDRRTRRTDHRQPRRHRDRHRAYAERQCLGAAGAFGQRQDRLDRCADVRYNRADGIVMTNLDRRRSASYGGPAALTVPTLIGRRRADLTARLSASRRFRIISLYFNELHRRSGSPGTVRPGAVCGSRPLSPCELRPAQWPAKPFISGPKMAHCSMASVCAVAAGAPSTYI